MKYLIETALLTHGLRSLTNNYLLENWTLPEALIAWIYKGEIKIGTITKYLSFRTEAQSAIRIDCSILENALKNGVSARSLPPEPWRYAKSSVSRLRLPAAWAVSERSRVRSFAQISPL